MPPKKARGSEQQPVKRSSTAVPRAKNTSVSTTTSTSRVHALPPELQQVILNVFSIAFPSVQDNENLAQVIQEVKGHLFNRDFRSAFSQPSYLEAYALRWSAARALSYSYILTHPDRAFLLTTPSAVSGIKNFDPFEAQRNDSKHSAAGAQARPVSGMCSAKKVVCLGGGAGAEIVALAAAHRHLDIKSPLKIVAVDSADWSGPVAELSSATSIAPALSSRASEAAKARVENRPLLEDSSKITVTFIHQNVLTWDVESIKHNMEDASLCTIMFTLNELFSASLPKTTTFLLNLTSSMPAGSRLLVVDSPGSYSEIQLGRPSIAQDDVQEPEKPSTKKYPMKWLLDHTLLEVAGSGDDAKWDRIESEDSAWFRIDQKERDRLRYPVELENMRYQLHLYQRI